MRECPVCKRPMTALFTSLVCDWCDGLVHASAVARGFVLWRAGDELAARDLYVFPTREMAERYRRSSAAEGVVREVLCDAPINWRAGRGTIRNLHLADRLYTVFPDHRFEPGPYRAWLAPESRRAA